jgi:hypothetical protein
MQHVPSLCYIHVPPTWHPQSCDAFQRRSTLPTRVPSRSNFSSPQRPLTTNSTPPWAPTCSDASRDLMLYSSRSSNLEPPDISVRDTVSLHVLRPPHDFTNLQVISSQNDPVELYHFTRCVGLFGSDHTFSAESFTKAAAPVSTRNLPPAGTPPNRP